MDKNSTTTGSVYVNWLRKACKEQSLLAITSLQFTVKESSRASKDKMSLFTRATGLSLLFWSLLSLKVSCTRSDTPKIDIGGVGKCVKLNSTACSRFNYSVPESISYLTSIKDYYINDIIGRLSVTETDADCQEGMRELLCLKEYSQCSEEEGTVNVPETNCSQLLQSCQKKDSLSPFCSFVLTDSRLRECKPVSHHASNYNYSLTQCNTIDDGITEWNFLYLKKRDQDIVSELKLIKSVGRTNEECEERYKAFRCGSIAYCSSEDTRLKLLTDRNECLYLRNHW